MAALLEAEDHSREENATREREQGEGRDDSGDRRRARARSDEVGEERAGERQADCQGGRHRQHRNEHGPHSCAPVHGHGPASVEVAARKAGVEPEHRDDGREREDRGEEVDRAEATRPDLSCDHRRHQQQPDGGASRRPGRRPWSRRATSACLSAQRPARVSAPRPSQGSLPPRVRGHASRPRACRSARVRWSRRVRRRRERARPSAWQAGPSPGRNEALMVRGPTPQGPARRAGPGTSGQPPLRSSVR